MDGCGNRACLDENEKVRYFLNDEEKFYQHPEPGRTNDPLCCECAVKWQCKDCQYVAVEWNHEETTGDCFMCDGILCEECWKRCDYSGYYKHSWLLFCEKCVKEYKFKQKEVHQKIKQIHGTYTRFTSIP